MLTTKIESAVPRFEGWEEKTIRLLEDGEEVATFRIYNADIHEWPHWHMVSVGNFESPEAASDHLISEWDREPTDDELWGETMAEATYRSGYAYACGERD